MAEPTLKERLARESFVGLAVTANFDPENTPKGFIEITMAVPEGIAFGSGLFEVRYLRPLTDYERSGNSYTALDRAQKPADGGA